MAMIDDDIFFLIFLLFVCSHIDCTEVQGYLCVEEPTPLSCASAAVIQEILCMYSEILSFLHTVVKVNTIFCFTLLQDHKALDRIMLLFSLDASHTGKLNAH